MTDAECTALLQWALPRRALRWAGFRRVRGQVFKRIRRRLGQLGLRDIEAYRARLEADPGEWSVLDGLCVITVSRFYRDRALWDALRTDVLPALADGALAAGEEELRCWSIGCASGEEPYTLSIAWLLGLADRYPALRLRILATDVDARVIGRAQSATYGPGTLKELPAGWREQAFDRRGDVFRLRERFRALVELRREDVRLTLPEERFRLILCRNLAFTYFDERSQGETLRRIVTRLSEGGALVVGKGERPPPDSALESWSSEGGVYRHIPDVGSPVTAIPNESAGEGGEDVIVRDQNTG